MSLRAQSDIYAIRPILVGLKEAYAQQEEPLDDSTIAAWVQVHSVTGRHEEDLITNPVWGPDMKAIWDVVSSDNVLPMIFQAFRCGWKGGANANPQVSDQPENDALSQFHPL